MPNQNFPVNVNVNFRGVTYSPTNGWSGTPTWTVAPDPVPVSPVVTGDHTITWNLHVAAVPPGFTGKFPATAAIVFAAGWTGGTPVRVDDNTWSVIDNFNGLLADVTCYYTINVSLDNGSGVVQNFPKDPDVQNDAGTGSILHRVK